VTIESEVRTFCDTLPLSDIHKGIAVQEALRAGEAEFGKSCALRIAAKLQTIRERFKPHFDREGVC
jgi:hypothetical protein